MDSAQNLYSAGAFIQAGIDATFASRLGIVRDVEVNFTPADSASAASEDGQPDLDQRAVVRFSTDSGVYDFNGLRLAAIHDGHLRWTTGMAEHAPQPEFHGTQPDSVLLRGLARRLVGDRPVVRVPQGDGEALVAVDFAEINPDPRVSILAGIEHSGDIAGGIDERLATAELASYLGIPQNHAENLALFHGTRIVALPQAPGHAELSAREVLADAHFLATEHNFFLEARFPNLWADLDPDTSRTMVNSDYGSLTVPAHLIATIDAAADTFTWAWADELSGSMSAQAAGNLRRFGYDQAIPELIRAHVSITEARSARLPQLAMPVLGLWTLLPVQLPDGRQGLALSDAPAFHLPAPTPAAAQATLNVAVPAGVDEQRARAAYHRARPL